MKNIQNSDIVSTIITTSNIIISNLKENKNLELVDIIEALIDTKIDIEQTLLNILENSNDELVLSSIIEYFNIGCNGNIISAIRKKVNHDSWLVRSYAIEALGDIQDINSKSLILKRLEFAHEEELPRIYYALIKLGERTYLHKLCGLLEHNNYRVRIVAATLLEKLISKENKQLIIDRIKQRLKKEKEKSVIDRLQLILKEVGD